jgi:DNA-directed RNA polymerase II subunit RPB4
VRFTPPVTYRKEYEGVVELRCYRIVTKTQAYLEVFSRFKQQETAQAVERILLLQKDLSSFERAQLGMLFLPQLWSGMVVE